jgi:hypothetical protein
MELCEIHIVVRTVTSCFVAWESEPHMAVVSLEFILVISLHILNRAIHDFVYPAQHTTQTCQRLYFSLQLSYRSENTID